MASSDVICTAASVWALLAGQRWLKSGDWRDGTALFLLLILALGTKEVGVLIAPLLTLWVVLQQRWFSSDKASFPSARLLPIWLLVALYLGLRGAVLGDHAVTAPDLNLQRIFTGLGEYVWGVIPFRFATDVHSLSKAEADATLTLFLAALAWIALASFGLFCCYRRATQPLYLLAWLVASCLPVLMVSDMNVPGVTGKYALSDRWLIQAAAASSILAALGLQHFSRQRLPRILGAATCVVWAGIQLVTADSTHAFYRNDLTFLQHEEQLFQDTPEQFRTEEDQCRHHNRIAITALTKHEFPKALHVYDTTPAFCEWERSRAFNQLSVLVALGEYERAEPILEELLQRSEGDRRANGSLHLLGARVMIEARDLDRAQFMLKRAATLGANNTDTTRLQELLAAKT